MPYIKFHKDKSKINSPSTFLYFQISKNVHSNKENNFLFDQTANIIDETADAIDKRTERMNEEFCRRFGGFGIVFLVIEL